MPKVNFTVKRVSEVLASVVNVSLFGALRYLRTVSAKRDLQAVLLMLGFLHLNLGCGFIK